MQCVRWHLPIPVCHLWLKYSATLPPQAKELESNSEYYLELLSEGIGKPKEEIKKDILRPKYFRAQEAIDYGLADKIISSSDDAFDKRVNLLWDIFQLLCWLSCFMPFTLIFCNQNYEEMLIQSRMSRPGAQAAPSGFRWMKEW